jgi:O-glycosyl hydrolase
MFAGCVQRFEGYFVMFLLERRTLTRDFGRAFVALTVPFALIASAGGAGAQAGTRAMHGGLARARVPLVSAAGSTAFNVQGAGASFSSSLPLSSVATYVWSPSGQSVQEWLTTPDGTSLGEKLTQQPSIPIASGPGPSNVSIAVDPGSTHQTMIGFGAAMTDSAAFLIHGSQASGAIIDALFGSSGARFNLVRLPIGGTDLVASRYPGFAQGFSLAHDEQYTIPVLRQAEQRQPGLNILATPWSAPASMKNGHTFDGDCTGEDDVNNQLNPNDLGAYANYLVNFLKTYQNEGLPVDFISMQNEPENCNSTYPTMNLPEPQEAKLAGILSKDIVGNDLATGIVGFDHNWYNNSGVDPYPRQLVADAGSDLAAVGYHCYDDGGNLDAYTKQIPYSGSLQLLMTECSGFLNDSDTAQNLVSEVREDLLGPIRYGASGSLYWSLALNGNGGPHLGGCSNCRGMVTINGPGPGDYTLSQDYYYWAQFSKFIDPGAVRIGSTDLGLGSIETVAFQNPDGSIVLVALNSASQQSYTGHIVQWEGDTKAQKTAWLVGPDGHRRWISNISTYNCLKANGAPGPDVLSSFALDELPDLTNVWAVCGADSIGVNSMLQQNFYARSKNSDYTLRLTGSNLTLTGKSGNVLWSTGRGGDDLILQSDGNLVEYSGSTPVWASNTVGSGAAWLIVNNNGTLDMYDKAGSLIWSNGQVLPAEPANPMVTSATGTSEVLTWTDASDNETSFVSQYRPVGSSTWISGPTVGANATTMTVSGLKTGTEYTFQVGARNPVGTHWSVYFYGWTQALPAEPTGGSASMSSTSAVLTWTDNSDNETSFVSQYRPDGSSTWITGPSVGANITSMTVTGLSPSTDYTFQVGAQNSVGTHWSAYFYGTTPALPPYHTGLQVSIDSQATGGDSGHTGPGNSYPAGPTHPANSPLWIVCYVNGQSISGPYDTTTIWDLSDDGYYYTDAWLYTGTNGPAVPPCAPDTVTVDSHATGGLSGHTGPDNSYPTGPTYPANTPITIVCYVNGQSIAGPYDTTTIWDLSGGLYYSDAWLYTGTNGPAVPPC